MPVFVTQADYNKWIFAAFMHSWWRLPAICADKFFSPESELSELMLLVNNIYTKVFKFN